MALPGNPEGRVGLDSKEGSASAPKRATLGAGATYHPSRMRLPAQATCQDGVTTSCLVVWVDKLSKIQNNPPGVQPKPSFTGVTSEGWVEACILRLDERMLLWGDGQVLLLSNWCLHLFDRCCHLTSCHHQGKRAHPGCCLGRSTATPSPVFPGDPLLQSFMKS